MKKQLLVLLCAFMFSGNVFADTFKGGHPACVTKDLFNQLATALINKDVNAFVYLLEHGCIITKKGVSVTVLDTTWTGMAKVRAYGGGGVILWTYTDNIVRSK